MLEELRELWYNHGFEIMLGVSITIIIIMFILRLGKKGTWSTNYTYTGQRANPTSRRPPTESKGELECRKVLQQIFNRSFSKARPDFLNNPVTGGSHNLELDCYCPELRLAIEYNGSQHYKYIPYFHKTRDAFTNQKYRDELKRRMCRDNGITLIEVPYTVKVPDIRNHLIRKLSALGYL